MVLDVDETKHANELPFTPAELVERTYTRSRERLSMVRSTLGRPLTLAEKILYTHLRSFDGPLRRGEDYIHLDPDRLALPDSSALMAMLQLMTTGEHRVEVPATVHCDHLISAAQGADADLRFANAEHGEVYDFLESATARAGIGLWRPGSGIIHQVILENYAFPGGLMFITDSHAPNAGGAAMMAIGVGGADAVDPMVGDPVTLRMPRLIGVHLTGRLGPWCAPKDVILEVASRLTVRGGTGAIVEYFGPGAMTISATGKATICNMGAEVGATTSLFPFDDAIARYLRVLGRERTADLAEMYAADLRSDDEVLADPDTYYDQVLTIDLSELRPLLSGPGSPDLVRPVERFVGGEVNDYPAELSYAMIGSCTNSSYEDIGRAADVARQALAAGMRAQVPLFVSPGSASVQATMERDGMLKDLVAFGATILANACGPCIGQWNRSDEQAGSRNSIITSFNRNFPRRNDGHSETLNFIASPEIVVAAAITGRLDVDPTKILLADGTRLTPPGADELPGRGWVRSDAGFVAPPPASTGPFPVTVAPDSERLQLLQPFAPATTAQYARLRILTKVSGPCTTDHISAAGPWLRFRGHLERIAANTLSGAVDAASGATGSCRDLLDGGIRPFHEVAEHYRDEGLPWVIIGDANYGEGSSREHAAMQVRYLGGLVVIARSFARIHEMNLKKQGLLPLTLVDPDDYDVFGPEDVITLPAPDLLAPDVPVEVRVTAPGGQRRTVLTRHTYDAAQLRWLWAGSAMNAIRVAAD